MLFIMALPALSLAAWTVDTPTANDIIAKNNDINCDGQADSQLTKVIRVGWQDLPAHWKEESSATCTITSDGMTPPMYTWDVTVPCPGGNWDVSPVEMGVPVSDHTARIRVGETLLATSGLFAITN